MFDFSKNVFDDMPDEVREAIMPVAVRGTVDTVRRKMDPIDEEGFSKLPDEMSVMDAYLGLSVLGLFNIYMLASKKIDRLEKRVAELELRVM